MSSVRLPSLSEVQVLTMPPDQAGLPQVGWGALPRMEIFG